MIEDSYQSATTTCSVAAKTLRNSDLMAVIPSVWVSRRVRIAQEIEGAISFAIGDTYVGTSSTGCSVTIGKHVVHDRNHVVLDDRETAREVNPALVQVH